MKTNKMIKTSLMIAFSLLIVMSSFSLSQMKAATVGPADVILAKETYSTSFYTEGIEILPLYGEAVGVHAGFIGGSVELPFDITTPDFNNLLAISLMVSNQRLWNSYANRRFWDVSDGATLRLVFRGSPELAIERGSMITRYIKEAYDIGLTLVYGHYDGEHQITILAYQGLMRSQQFDYITSIFPDFISDEGFGEGITQTTLAKAPVKAMGISLYRGAVFRNQLPAELRLVFPTVGLTTGFIPIVECGWIDPTGLVKTGTVIEMNLTSLMPDLSSVVAAPNSVLSVISMKLPYIVDVLAIEPKTDNMYSHLKGEFTWGIKLDIPALNVDLTQGYPDIYVKYDLNLSGLMHFPQVIGEMSLDSTLPIDGNEDLVYSFFFENVGNEPAYDLNLAYGEFNLNETNGLPLWINNPELTFESDKVMFYNSTSQILTDTVQPLGDDDIIVITGWFLNNTAGDYLRNDMVVLPEEFDNPEGIIYIEENFLEVDTMDFAFENTTNDDGTDTGYATLTTTIPVLNPGENVTKKFAMRNLPSGSFTQYQVAENTSNVIQLSINTTYNWEELIVIILQLLGSSLHIPEDQVTWTNWFPEPVIGSTYYYQDADEKQYAGLTNGLVIQAYDDEAVLVAKVSLDKDVYRFGEEVTFSLEFTNIGNADATDVDYQFFHGFVGDDYELRYVAPIPEASGTIERITPGQTIIVQNTTIAASNIGLHPVFAVFGYTSDEADDPDYPIFSSCRHPAVFSSMDFGIILPPVDKEGTTKPTYPTPEVDVTTEVLGYVANETSVGDTITLRTTITNVGDEPTNIIYIQRIPRRLSYVFGSLDITVDDVDIDPANLQVDYFAYNPNFGEANYNPFMPTVVIYDSIQNGGPHGIPLGVNETLVIEADFTILKGRNIDYVDWSTVEGENLIGLYIPPAEIRFQSSYDMIQTSGINEDTEVPTDEATAIGTSSISTLDHISVLDINDETIPGEDWASTNSWGSYSDSLTLSVFESIGIPFYYGIGVIAVTGVAILIYFKANGKRK